MVGVPKIVGCPTLPLIVHGLLVHQSNLKGSAPLLVDFARKGEFRLPESKDLAKFTRCGTWFLSAESPPQKKPKLVIPSKARNLLSSIFYPLSSIFYLLSSIFYLLSSIIFYLLSSIFYPRPDERRHRCTRFSLPLRDVKTPDCPRHQSHTFPVFGIFDPSYRSHVSIMIFSANYAERLLDELTPPGSHHQPIVTALTRRARTPLLLQKVLWGAFCLPHRGAVDVPSYRFPSLLLSRHCACRSSSAQRWTRWTCGEFPLS